jgi:hypothetical protein
VRPPPHVERVVMADVVDAAAIDDGTSGTARARIFIPSGQLLVTFSLGFEPATAGVVSSYAGATWSANLVRTPDPKLGGGEAELHSLFATKTLPQEWGLVGVIREEVNVVAALTVPQVGGVDAPGSWVLVVKFEAAVPMCPEEWAELESQCVVRPVRKLLLDIA